LPDRSHCKIGSIRDDESLSRVPMDIDT